MILKAKELKRNARMALSGNYGFAVYTFLLSLLMSGVLSMVQDIFGLPNALSSVASVRFWVVFLIISVLTALINIGYTRILYNMRSHLPYSARDLFYAFRVNPDHFIVSSFVTTLAAYLCLLPALGYSWYVLMTDQGSLVLLLVLFVLGSAAYFVLNCMFALYAFLLFDNPQLGGIAALKESCRMMRGHKWRYFYLDLSFLGLSMLGLLSFGIGLLWVSPYIQMTSVEFYLNLKECGGEMDEGVNVRL